MSDTDEAGTFEQWLVTGDPGHGYPAYRFVWGQPTGRMPGPGDTAEGEARRFVAQIEANKDAFGSWPDGPHLHRRTVTVTAWEPVE